MSPAMDMTIKTVVHRRLSRKHVMNHPSKVAMTEATLIVEGEVKKRWPRGSPGTSTSFRSIGHEVDRRTPPRWGKVTTSSGYGAAVDQGRKAGRPPPVRAIAPWVRRAGMPASAAYPVARAIGLRGTEGVFAFRDGGRAARRPIKRLLGGKVRQDIRRWRKRAPRGRS